MFLFALVINKIYLCNIKYNSDILKYNNDVLV